MTLRDLTILLQPLHNRVVNMVARAVVKAVADDKKMQLLQLAILSDEVKDDVERVQNYGFTSVPKEGAEAVVVCVGGKRDHTLVVAVDDRRYRIGNLESGEVAVYDATGSTIVLKKNGDIEVTPSSGKLKVTADVTVTGKLDVGDVNSSGTVTASTDVVGGGVHLKTHQHTVSAVDGTSSAPCTFTPAGKTGVPA